MQLSLSLISMIYMCHMWCTSELKYVLYMCIVYSGPGKAERFEICIMTTWHLFAGTIISYLSHYKCTTLFKFFASFRLNRFSFMNFEVQFQFHCQFQHSRCTLYSVSAISQLIDNLTYKEIFYFVHSVPCGRP